MIFVTLFMGMIALLIILVGLSLFYSGQFVGLPIMFVGIVLLIIIGVLSIRR